MKKYEKPVLEITEFDTEDLTNTTTSMNINNSRWINDNNKTNILNF